MANFKVLSAERQQRLLPNGRAGTVYVAWLETSRGATGSIEVPAGVWEGEGLREFLQAEADKLDKAFVLINEA